MGKFKSKLGAFVKGEKLSSSVLTVIVIGLVVAVNVIVYVLGSYFGLFLFTPPEMDFSISGATDEYFEDAIEQGKEVKIMFCRAKDEIETNNAGRYVMQTALQFAERYPDFIKVDFLNIVTRTDSEGNYVDLSKYQMENEDGQKSNLLKSSVIFECEDNVKVVVDDYSSTGYSDFFTLDSSGNAYAYNGEEVIASMVMWVLKNEHKTAYFTTRHGETADFGFRNMLNSAGYNIEMLDLRNSDIEIPPEDALVVISNPKKDFERAQEGSNIIAEIEKLREFMHNGGSLYVAIDPYADELPVLESFIAEFGIEISASEHSGNTLRNIVRDSNNAITSDFYTLVADNSNNEISKQILEKTREYNNSKVIVKESAVLELDESKGAIPLLSTSSSSALYSAGERIDSAGEYCVAALSTYENKDGDIGSMVVIPGIYLTATDVLTSGGYANREFVYAMLEKAFGIENLPYGCNTVFYTEGILENLTMGTARVYAVLLLMIPVAVACVGAFVIVKRKNR